MADDALLEGLREMDSRNVGIYWRGTICWAISEITSLRAGLEAAGQLARQHEADAARWQAEAEEARRERDRLDQSLDTALRLYQGREVELARRCVALEAERDRLGAGAKPSPSAPSVKGIESKGCMMTPPPAG